MKIESKWLLTDEEKDSFIATITPNLTVLRTKAEISQEELANLIGVSRQTYSAIERKVRRMAWSTYLSLVLFYDHNQKTHKMIRQLSIFPQELIIRFNDGVDYSDYEISSFLGNKSEEIIEHLDERTSQRRYSCNGYDGICKMYSKRDNEIKSQSIKTQGRED